MVKCVQVLFFLLRFFWILSTFICISESCDHCQWSAWGTCSHRCGGGQQRRHGTDCCLYLAVKTRQTQKRRCNEFCENGGNFTTSCQCKAGFRGMCCQLECEEGYFGQDCKFECKCPEDTKCDKGNGVCLRAEPFTENKITRFSTTTYIIIGVAVGGFIFAQAIIVTICFKTKQKKRKGYQNDTSQAEKFWPCAAETVIGNPSSADKPENHYDEIKCITKGDNTKKKESFKKSFKKESKKLKKQTSIESTTIYQGLGLDYIDDGYQTLTSRNKEQVQNPNYMTPQLCDDTAPGPMDVISSMVTDTKMPRYLSMAGKNTDIERHDNPYVSMYNDEQ